MEVLQQEIVKLLAKGARIAGEIKNALNGEGWEVSQDEVLSALRRLEDQLFVECVWRIVGFINSGLTDSGNSAAKPLVRFEGFPGEFSQHDFGQVKE